MDKKARILIVDDALVIRSVLNEVLKKDYEVVGDAGNGRDGVELAKQLKPDVVLMDVTMPVMDGIEATRQIKEAVPETDVIIVSAVNSGESVRAGLAAGARDYLFKPVKPKEVVAVVERILAARDSKAEVQKKQESGSNDGIWSFTSPKGGDGTSTFLLSVANELLELGKKVIVLDADLHMGDIRFYLDLDGKSYPLTELLHPDERLDAQKISTSIVMHSSGLEVMGLAPLGTPEFGTPPERLIELTHWLLRVYDIVLVDHPVGLPDQLLPILDDSKHIFVVSRGTPENLKNFRTYLKVLEACGFEESRLHGLVNRCKPEEVEPILRRLEISAKAILPSDARAVVEATKEGQPVTRVAPRSLYTEGVRTFLKEILVEEPPPEAEEASADAAPKSSKGLFQRLLGR